MRVLIVQAIIGAGSVVLIADATKRITTPRAGVLIGVALAGYAMSVAFDVFILGESLLLLLGSLTLWLTVRGGRGLPLWTGTLIGAMGLGRPTFLLLLLPLGAYSIHRARPYRARAVCALLAVPIMVASLTAWHQWRMDGSWTPITYGGGYNFYVGNGPLATGTYVQVTGAYDPAVQPSSDIVGGTQGDGRNYLAGTLGLHLSPSESSRYWFGTALAYIRTHPAEAGWLLLRKLGLLFNRRELPQVVDTATYERAAGLLGWPLGWGFAFFGIGGLLGFAVAWWKGAAARLVCGWLVTLALGCATFFVVDRYRIHLIPPLAILTAIGLEHAAITCRTRRWREVWKVAGIVAVAGLLVFLPLIPEDPVQAEWSYANTMGDAWLAKGEPRRALPLYEQAVAIERSGLMQGTNTTAGRIARARMHENAAIAYALLGDDKAAVERLTFAVQLAPEAASTRARYAEELALSGRLGEAQTQYAAAGIPLQEVVVEMVRQAEQRERRGDLEGTRKLLATAVGILPSSESAVVPLVRLEILVGALDTALSRLRLAEAAGMDMDVVRVHEAWIRAAKGDTAGARRCLESIQAETRAKDPRIATTLELLERQTRWRFTPAR